MEDQSDLCVRCNRLMAMRGNGDPPPPGPPSVECDDCAHEALAESRAEVERLTNKTTDLRADLHRIRGERDHAKKLAEKAVAAEVARLRARVAALEAGLREVVAVTSDPGAHGFYDRKIMIQWVQSMLGAVEDTARRALASPSAPSAPSEPPTPGASPRPDDKEK